MHATCLVLAALTVAPALADPGTDSQIFGKDPGTSQAFACFARHYAKAHLVDHPKQNVTDMLLVVDSAYDTESRSRSYALTLGVNFRGLDKQFQAYGGCDGTVGTHKLSCYIDCDGGAIDVRFKDQNSILVDIPYGARIEDPNADPEASNPSATVPDKATFGPDDKTFLLSRVEPALCAGLVSDDDRQAILDAGR
ncbi:MAG TPA: hypothetical protein VHA07_07465 [Devosia sp.]|nr:hypothetical protein [Devosia sp.]